MGDGPDAAEKSHFLEVCYSFLEYGTDAFYDLGRMQDTIQSLDKDDQAMWKVPPLPWYSEIQRRVQVNLDFLRPGKGPVPAILCPGCGLARLPFDLVRLGYAAQGNEFSYHMLLGTHLILNRSEKAECFNIFPFVLTLANRKGRWDHLRCVKVPDVCPVEALGPAAQLSMAAGEFVEVYKTQESAWDGMATCFFLDTAKNVFLYIRTIAYIIRKGGIWTNLGPLLYHYADVPHEISIELSWEEVRPYICQYFDFVEEEEKVARYTGNAEGLSINRYRCIFFVARRNGKPAEGHSNPVF
ncbi:Carnosine N-methyltransferase [Durusdinium trenchii]|uniref:Carnosine N-methyltransferase n=1 Tax=Durusdinium trenchii TaxID=1381693 RepID=A0ABP0PC88_9DINO